MAAWFVWIGLTAGHFIFQMTHDGDWSAAAERSYFQGCALLTLWLARRFIWRAPQ